MRLLIEEFLCREVDLAKRERMYGALDSVKGVQVMIGKVLE
jgi:hypothetical protein